MTNDIVNDSKVVEIVDISPKATSVIDPTIVESYAPTLDEIHEFFKDTSDDVDVRVKSSTPTPTDVHTRDNDTSDTEREPGVESTVTTLNYHLSNRTLEFLSMIHRVVSSFSSFSVWRCVLSRVSHYQSLLHVPLASYASYFYFIRSHHV